MDTEFAVLHGALLVVGVGAGFVNTMAGGGSMAVLPVLMLLGLPADVANGTLRMSILTQSASGTLGFRRAGRLDAAAIPRVLAPTVLGSLVGALGASMVDPAVLKYVLLLTMLIMAIVLVVRPGVAMAPADSQPVLHARPLAALIGLFVAGVYGGFVQAGVGFVLLSVLSGVLRYDLMRANALKMVCTTIFGGVALAVFAAAGQVAWGPACLLAVYTTIGSQLGVRFSLGVRQDVVRWIIFVAVVTTCVGALFRG